MTGSFKLSTSQPKHPPRVENITNLTMTDKKRRTMRRAGRLVTEDDTHLILTILEDDDDEQPKFPHPISAIPGVAGWSCTVHPDIQKW